MSKEKVLFALVVGFSISGSALFAEEAAKVETAEPMAEAAVAVDSSSQPVDVGNTVCPISHEKTMAMGKPVKKEYKGKIYNLCCAMCVKDFDKNPEKYVKQIEEEMAKEKK